MGEEGWVGERGGERQWKGREGSRWEVEGRVHTHTAVI
jgi:hypothetical protein